jgi:hypothetical protein
VLVGSALEGQVEELVVGTVMMETVVVVVGCTVVVEVRKIDVELVGDVVVKVVVQRAVEMKAAKRTAIDERCIVELASNGIDLWD